MISLLEEIEAFETWAETNHLPAFSQLLFYKLLIRCNRSGWREWVQVGNQVLMGECQIGSEKTFVGYRDKLIETGLFEYKKGSKSSPNKYKYIPLTGKNYSIYDSINDSISDSINDGIYEFINGERRESAPKTQRREHISYNKKKSIKKEKDSLTSFAGENESISAQIDYTTIMKMFNSSGFFPVVTEITLPRRNAIRKLFEKYNISTLEKVIAMVGCSDYLSGKTTNWRCSFDWLIKPENFLKVLEGNYANNKKSPSNPSSAQSYQDLDPDLDYGNIFE